MKKSLKNAVEIDFPGIWALALNHWKFSLLFHMAASYNEKSYVGFLKKLNNVKFQLLDWPQQILNVALWNYNGKKKQDN